MNAKPDATSGRQLANRKLRRCARKKAKAGCTEPAQRATNQMVELFRRGETESCLTAARQFTDKWPNILAGWSILSVCLQMAGDHHAAELAGRQALRIDDDNADTHNILGATFKSLGNLEEAGFHFGRAIELKPNCARAHNNLGSVLVGLKRQDEAEILFRRAIALKSDWAIAHYQLACLLRETDRTAQAQTEFETALNCQPNFNAARIGLGHVMSSRPVGARPRRPEPQARNSRERNQTAYESKTNAVRIGIVRRGLIVFGASDSDGAPIKQENFGQ